MKLEKTLGVELPIIQAPMAGVQDSALAIQVSHAGGLGSVPCAALSLNEIELELRSIKQAATGPVNLNFFCHHPPKLKPSIESRWHELLMPYFIELGIELDAIPTTVNREPFSHAVVDILEPFEPPVISFHFGLPTRDLIDRLKLWGTTILSSATTLEEALWLQENGADMIIAQGIEAGGHRGMFLTKSLESQSSTASLVSEFQEKIKLPIIAAGGISSASDVASQLNIGAFAVQIGTAYLLCDEANTSPLHRRAIKENNPPTTTLTNLFSGRPARAIINRVIKELGPINQEAPEFPLAAKAMSTLRKVAERNNSSDFSPLWCGQNTQACESLPAYEQTLKLASKLGINS